MALAAVFRKPMLQLGLQQRDRAGRQFDCWRPRDDETFNNVIQFRIGTNRNGKATG